MNDYEKIALSLRHCANGIGNCQVCCEYGESNCNNQLKQDAADAIEELLKQKRAEKMPLKPCPFCGSKKTGVAETALGNYANIFFLAVCDECGARTKLFRDGDKAADAWNRREK